MYSSTHKIELDMSALAASSAKRLPGGTTGPGATREVASLNDRLWVIPPRSAKPVIVVVVNSPVPARIQVSLFH